MTEKQMITLLKTATNKTTSDARRRAAAKKLRKALKEENWSNYFAFRRVVANWLENRMTRMTKILRDRKMALKKQARP
jgi:hypothetical protein